MLVSEVMTRDLLTVPSAAPIREAIARAVEREVHHVLVVDVHRLRGVTCICDLREMPNTAPIGSAIIRAPELVWAQSTLQEAARRFVEKGLSCFPVCDEDALVGVVTRGDLRRSRVLEAELPASFRCTFCGSTRHVRPVLAQPGLAACLDCQDRMAPASIGLYDEGCHE